MYATGKAYITEPTTMPVKPYIPPLSQSSFVRLPFEPNRMISPIPCEMDGMSIGSRIHTPKTALSHTLVRVMHHAATAASSIAMTVEVSDTTTECSTASPTAELESSAGMSV